MIQKIAATFDGAVFSPDEPIDLATNTRVAIIIETLPLDDPEPTSFLQTARSLNLDGPADWSANLDNYLYGQETQQDNGSTS